MKTVIRIARKEFAGFFSSPAAFIFFGAFLAVTLFVVFWVETFFARNLADVRPLFEWMPILLIFLSAAITMRMWSEERRAGTMEFLLTAPVPPWQLVVGKFLACVALVAVALALTLPLPVTVSLIGPLDWGPVFGGYLATLFLAGAYIAIGLFVSAGSANQIVSLIVASLLGGIFYALSSDVLTALFGSGVGEALKLLGTGARFESISRGVLDLRDLFYYVSLVGAFLSLNVFVLERQRWAGNANNSHHRRWALITALLTANFFAANLWLSQVDSARADVTEGRIYSISESTRGYLAQLKEPLLIRGYFSAKTHPLLAPLVPRIRDLLEEYDLAGEGRVRVEFIDPQQDPELEQEAGEKYGIRPVPFQFASKYEASVVNSYFDVLIQYGDQHEVLGFRDLIEVKVESERDLEVELRNPEYDITRAIKKVLYSYQGAGELFENIPYPVTFKGYLSPEEKLPPVLIDFKNDLSAILEEYKTSSAGKFTVEISDPEASGGALARQLAAGYGFRPMSAGLFSPETFWFYLMLEGDGRIIQIPLPAELDKAGLERSLDSALKRFSRGFLKTVALHTPPPPAPQHFGMPQGGKSFNLLRDKLSEEYNVRSASLEEGQVPEEADILLLAAPANLSEKQLFAVDQFLMLGGTVVISSSPFDIGLQGNLTANRHEFGLLNWLGHNGITVEESMVLDPQNAAFPIPVQRRLGGFVVQETRLVEYPYFADIREDGLGERKGLTAGIDQVTMTWPSPISLDEEKNKGRKVVTLLESSPDSWVSENIDIQPNFQRYGSMGFAAGEGKGRRTLAAVVEGSFDSYFHDKPSPLAEKEEQSAGETEASGDSEETAQEKEPVITRVIDRSPDSARIILFASNTFLTDTSLDLAASGMGTRYLNPVQIMKNAVDWSLEDRGLLSIRGRTHYSRTLSPLAKETRIFWEYLNYGLAVMGLFAVWIARRLSLSRARIRCQAVMNAGRA